MHLFLTTGILLAAAVGLAAFAAPAAGHGRPTDPPGSPEDDARVADAFALLERAVDKGQIPGAAALVARHGRVLREAAYGFSDVESRTPFRTDTVCWIASITKPVTTAAAMKLVEKGALRLDDAVERYLPEFREQSDAQGRHHAYTIRQLMTHTTGLPSEPPNRADVMGAAWRSTPLKDAVPPMARATLEFAPGTRVLYSNTAYYLLGRIIEIVSGKACADYVKEAIFDPLGMTESYFPRFLPAAPVERLAANYQPNRDRRVPYFRYDPGMALENDTPDGGIFCTARDLLKFYQAFLEDDGRVLSRESVDEMLREQAPGRGLGWSLRHGGFAHGGSSGAFAWGDPDTGVVGILMLQYNDFDQVPYLQSRFAESVRAAFGTPDPVPTRTVKQYDPCDIRLTTRREYANPFRDVQVWAELQGPSGEKLRIPGFHDGGKGFIVRARFDEPGVWRVTTGATPADPDLESRFSLEVAPSGRKGPLRVTVAAAKSPTTGQPARAARLIHADGSAFFHAGDTCYPLLHLDRQTQLLPYLERRAAQGFSHIRFHCFRGALRGGPQSWPWGGTPQAPDLDRFDPRHFALLDGILRDLRARGLGAEMILLNFYAGYGPMTDSRVWTREREEAWVRYLVARYAAFDNVVYWTLANEFETYPDGSYRIDPGDIEWARRAAALVKDADPYGHPVTVHPFMPYAEYLASFGHAPEIDLLMFQEHGRDRRVAPAVADGDGEGLEDKVLAARVLGKPVIVGEYGYEWDGVTHQGCNSTTDLLRRQTWRIVMGGGGFSAGFRSTVFNFAGITFDPDNGARPGGEQIATLLRFFKQRTRFQHLEPRFELVSDPNLCLRGDGELVVYAPLGGEVAVDLAEESGEFTATWLNPATGDSREAGRVRGGGNRSLTSPWGEAVLHLRGSGGGR